MPLRKLICIWNSYKESYPWAFLEWSLDAISQIRVLSRNRYSHLKKRKESASFWQFQHSKMLRFYKFHENRGRARHVKQCEWMSGKGSVQARALLDLCEFTWARQLWMPQVRRGRRELSVCWRASLQELVLGGSEASLVLLMAGRIAYWRRIH